MVEVFHCSGFAVVRAGVRRWASAARIGRFPVEIVPCDVTDRAQVREALRDVWAVVHCAVGDHRVIVEGTRTVLDEARAAGVARVVHLSTIDVYGDVSGDVDEAMPRRSAGRAYGDAKIVAEEVCEAMGAATPVTILRPTLVHGPFSSSWTIEFAQRLQQRPWTVPSDVAQGTCNLVYVDDLVEAARLALIQPQAVGEAFNVNGPERPTWNDYFEALNRVMGLPALEYQSRLRSMAWANAMVPVRTIAKTGLRHFGGLIMGAYQRSALARRMMKRVEGLIRNSPTPAEFSLYSCWRTSLGSDCSRRSPWWPRGSGTRGASYNAHRDGRHSTGGLRAPLDSPYPGTG